MNPSFYRRDRTNPEMGSSSLTASLLLLSLAFMQFVSAADQNNAAIKAEPGDNVILPCKDPDQGKITIAEWKRTDLESLGNVLLCKDDKINPGNQLPSYRDRADLLINQIRKGDVSLILKNTKTNDSGTYECRIDTEKRVGELISTINLVVAPRPPEPFPVWATVLLVLLVLLVLVLALVAALGVSVYFWLRWKPVPEQVEVEPGKESVLLPFKVPRRLWFCKYRRSVAKVEWKDVRDNRTVHVHQNGSDCSAEQNQRYRTRTKMDKDLSLTLRRPTCEDSGIYSCRVYSKDRDVLMVKQVQLRVKAQQVEVESGVKSVLLHWRITESLNGDVRVEWMDGDNRKVHVYQNGSDCSDEQHESYKGRTKMAENPLKTKDLSLTLMNPTYSNVFTCRVSRDKTVLMMKQVQLEVKDQLVEANEGAESVQLEFKVTFDLRRGDRVEWWDKKERIVHVYQNGSDLPVEQAEFYKDRTRMNKDALETKDLSLTLSRPTERDTRRFRCGVYRNGELLRIKTFQLNIKAGTVQVQPEDTRKPLLDDQSV